MAFRGISAGSVFVRLGADVDRAGFEEFEQRHVRATKLKDVEARLGAKVDQGDFNKYFDHLDQAQKRASRKDAFKASLGADYNPAAFRAYERDLRKAERANQDMVNSSGKLHTAFGNVYGRGGALFAAAGGIYGLTTALKSVSNAYGESEVSQRKMDAQLKALGFSYRAHAKEIDNVIQKTSQLSGLDDEDLQNAFTNIVRVTGNVNQSLRLTGLAADFARAKHLDVAKAGEIVAKVAGGNTGILSRYGIQIEKGATASQALAALQQKFAGQAKAYGETQKGAGDRARVAFENLQESLGRHLAPALTKVFNATANFLNQLSTGTGTIGRFEEKVTSSIRNIRTTVTRWVDRNRADIDEFLSGIRTIGHVVESIINGVVLPTIRRMIPGVRQAFSGVVDVVRGAVKVISSILKGNFGDAWDGVKTIFSGGIRAAIGTLRAQTAPARELASRIGHAVVSGVLSGLDGLGHAILDKVKGAAGFVGKAVSKLNPFGDGLGKKFGDGLGQRLSTIAPPPTPGGGLPNLMGAQPALAPFAALGSRFGLNVSSGRRPGAITSSGNVSYHSSGEAIDEAGSPSGMMGYFRYLKNNMGPRLAELIYTPGGVGIKNGQPFRYTGAVAADHYDHVHVAYDTGRPGVGDGLGKFAATSYGPPWGGIQGTGVTAPASTSRTARTSTASPSIPTCCTLGSSYYVWPNPFGYAARSARSTPAARSRATASTSTTGVAGRAQTRRGAYTHEQADRDKIYQAQRFLDGEFHAGAPIDTRDRLRVMGDMREVQADLQQTLSAPQGGDADAIAAQFEMKASRATADLLSANKVIAAFGSTGDIGTGGSSAYKAVLNAAQTVGAQYSPGQSAMVVNNYNMPGAPEVLRAIGDAATAGQSLQPSVSTSVTRLGI
jgi:hypothetical protein